VIATLFAAACLATAVHGEPLPSSGALSALRWVQATPHRAGIVGMIFGYDAALEEPTNPTFALWTGGAAPQGWATKILWIVRNPHAGGEITVRGRALDGTRTFAQRFRQVWDASDQPASGSEYASIVDIPSAGCWRLDVSAGRRVRGFLVVRAVSP
jgi:hypothetical protein